MTESHAEQLARVHAGVARRVQQLEALERSFLHEATRYAPGTKENAHSMHRAHGCRLDIDRLKRDGGKA